MAKSEIISCPACGHDVAKSAKVCPNCGAKPSKGFGKTFNGKLLKWIIILYICIGIDFIAFNRATPNANSSGASSTESTTPGDTSVGDSTGVLDTTQPVSDTGVTNTDGGGVTGTEGTQTDGAVTDAGAGTNTDATQPTDTTQTTTP